KFAAMVFDTAKMRAVEERRWLVRASTSGPSGIVDPNGRVVAATGRDSPATLGGSLIPTSTRAPYSRVGDLFALLCAAAVALAVLRRVASSRVRHGADDATPVSAPVQGVRDRACGAR